MANGGLGNGLLEEGGWGGWGEWAPPVLRVRVHFNEYS